MKRRLKWLVPVILIVVLIALYLWPVSSPSFEELYSDVDMSVANSLTAFRVIHPTKIIDVNNEAWEYVVMGEGEDTIIFLHGMTGAYDIWWQ